MLGEGDVGELLTTPTKKSRHKEMNQPVIREKKKKATGEKKQESKERGGWGFLPPALGAAPVVTPTAKLTNSDNFNT